MSHSPWFLAGKLKILRELVEEKVGQGGDVDPVATFVGELASPAALAKAQNMGL